MPKPEPKLPRVAPVRFTRSEIELVYMNVQNAIDGGADDPDYITIRAKLLRAIAGVQPTRARFKDHQIAGVVNHVRDVAIKYHGTEQLRERVRDALNPLIEELRYLQQFAPANGVPQRVAGAQEGGNSDGR